MKEVKVSKASGVGRFAEGEDTVITISGQRNLDKLTLNEVGQFFDLEAQKLFDALYNSLPGGTFDRLTGLMLAKKASHFIVSHDRFDKKVES